MTSYGTNHFASRTAAERYYAAYGYDDIASAVTRKLAEGEIHIGAPACKPGERAILNSREGRYFIEGSAA